VAYYLHILFALDFKKDLKLRLQEGKMANIVTNDVQTYVKDLVSKEFNPAAKNGHKIETEGEPERRYPERTPFAWDNRQGNIPD
jgi:hypothetical protein